MPRVSDMKERLTDAALDLMWENSYGTTSVDAICERAGAKKGSFYYFFKSKSELTAAALEAEWHKNKANMDALFSPTVPPLERFDRYFDYVHDHLAEFRSQGEGALCLLSRDARPGPNSKRRRIASRFQAGRDGCSGRETHPSCFLMIFFFANFIDDRSNTTERNQVHAN